METENTNSTELRVWMLREGIKPGQIKDDLELTATAAVTQFVNGKMTSRPIAAYLIGKGCPKGIVNAKTGRLAA